MAANKLTLGALGLCIGGLAPLITGFIGMRDYLAQGYFISKTGQQVEGPLAATIATSYVLMGLIMIGCALRLIANNRKHPHC